MATGGGAVLDQDNVDALRQNGKLIFLDRPPEELIPTADRPLASTADAIRRRYAERLPLYTQLPHAGAETEKTDSAFLV